MENNLVGQGGRPYLYQSSSGRRYGRQYAYMTYRPISTFCETADNKEINVQCKKSEDKVKLVARKVELANLFTSFDKSNLKMGKRDMKRSSSKVDGSQSGSGVSVGIKPGHSHAGVQSDTKVKPVKVKKELKEGARTKKGVSNSTKEVKISVGKGKLRKLKSKDDSDGTRKQTLHDRNWQSEGGKPKAVKNNSPDSQKKQLRRKRAVSSGDKQEQSKHVKHGAKATASGSGSSSVHAKPNSKNPKDSPRSTSDSSTHCAPKRKSKTQKKSNDDIGATSTNGHKDALRKKTKKSKKQSNSTDVALASRRRNTAANMVASLPPLCDSSDSDSEIEQELSSRGSRRNGHLLAAGAASHRLPPLVSDSNSDEFEYTEGELSDMEDEEVLYRAADSWNGADDFFPFVHLQPPTNPFRLIVQSSYTQNFMQMLFEDAILQMLALHPELQGEQAPPPATQDIIDTLPKVKVVKKQIDDEISCAICQCEYKIDDTVNKLPCDHLFHPICINAWLQKSGTCPVCRHVLKS
uniref:E3 ubiquitin-protein ligase Praja-2-like isoform X2 n=1 Tax=Saccoglossus kowalevskii TaxID=10224 RepID=A0ABM0MES0_SACKO|nr:PREDICTED: E3 ubiquitin-protein ligase Praja-2-like isoform X2 [Saccoglossus kowalevskii]